MPNVTADGEIPGTFGTIKGKGDEKMFDNNLSAYKNALQNEEKSAHTVEAGSDRVAHNLRHLFARTFYCIQLILQKIYLIKKEKTFSKAELQPFLILEWWN